MFHLGGLGKIEKSRFLGLFRETLEKMLFFEKFRKKSPKIVGLFKTLV